MPWKATLILKTAIKTTPAWQFQNWIVFKVNLLTFFDLALFVVEITTRNGRFGVGSWISSSDVAIENVLVVNLAATSKRKTKIFTRLFKCFSNPPPKVGAVLWGGFGQGQHINFPPQKIILNNLKSISRWTQSTVVLYDPHFHWLNDLKLVKQSNSFDGPLAEEGPLIPAVSFGESGP